PVVPQDYVSGWSFYEASGSTVHDMNATNHNDGTISGTGQWVPGIGCPNCAGLRLSDNGRIAVPDSNSLDLSATGSIACWVNLRETPSWVGLVHKGTNLVTFSDETYSFQFVDNRQVRLYINAADGSTRSVTSAALPNNNQWYHVATTWDAATLKIYVNGVLSASAANTGGKAAKVNASAVTIGAQGPGWPYYSLPGTIDEVYLYNRALTATEIADMALGHP
ncbi:MAG: LamG domain-containing protein, partial [Humidesulfovibrio sp.]|nr:LamG domain-containing protein [Humidesulfovibrio sp.]